MGFFGDLLMGSRPDMRYTGAQDQAMSWGNSYGEQFNPLYNQDVRRSNLYERGGVGKKGRDKSGKLTAFLGPVRQMLEANREATVDQFSRQAGSGFSPGGAAYANAGSARLRNEANRDIGSTLGGMYVQRGEQLHDRVTNAYEAAKARELQAHNIAAGVAGSGPYDARRSGGLLQQGLGLGVDLLKKYAEAQMNPAAAATPGP